MRRAVSLALTFYSRDGGAISESRRQKLFEEIRGLADARGLVVGGASVPVMDDRVVTDA